MKIEEPNFVGTPAEVLDYIGHLQMERDSYVEELRRDRWRPNAVPPERTQNVLLHLADRPDAVYGYYSHDLKGYFVSGFPVSNVVRWKPMPSIDQYGVF